VSNSKVKNNYIYQQAEISDTRSYKDWYTETNPNCGSNREDQHTKTLTHDKQKSAFVAGDSITRILSSAKLSDNELNVKIRTHPGGRVKTIRALL